MSQRRTLTYPSADGRQTIQAVEWLPEGEPRGVIQIVHGIAEHMGRYAHVAEFSPGGAMWCAARTTWATGPR